MLLHAAHFILKVLLFLLNLALILVLVIIEIGRDVSIGGVYAVLWMSAASALLLSVTFLVANVVFDTKDHRWIKATTAIVDAVFVGVCLLASYLALRRSQQPISDIKGDQAATKNRTYYQMVSGLFFADAFMFLLTLLVIVFRQRTHTLKRKKEEEEQERQATTTGGSTATINGTLATLKALEARPATLALCAPPTMMAIDGSTPLYGTGFPYQSPVYPMPYSAYPQSPIYATPYPSAYPNMTY